MKKKDYINLFSIDQENKQNCDKKKVPVKNTTVDYKNDLSKTWAASCRNDLFCDVIKHKMDDPL